MRIALDAMGSDNSPEVEVEGAVQAAYEGKGEREVVLVGDREILEKELSKLRRVPEKLTIHHAPEVIKMEERPVEAVRRKKDSSIFKAMELLKSGRVDAVVSAGNTGAVVAGAILSVGTLPGIDRPAIAAIIPSANDISILIDAGANSDCKPHNLLQFAMMGTEYARFLMEKSNPQVRLLSIGAESSKGNELTREAHKLLRESRLNFMGNVEGRSVFLGNADVIVSDGFVGNIVLKTGEGLAAGIGKILIKEIKRHPLRTIGGMLMKPAFIRLRKRGDYSEYGGAPLLGINGICIICHGSSSPKAILNAILVSEAYAVQGINKKIMDRATVVGSSKEQRNEPG